MVTDSKKPAGAAMEMENYFGCSASDIVLVRSGSCQFSVSSLNVDIYQLPRHYLQQYSHVSQ
jgi:hypothetical protein